MFPAKVDSGVVIGPYGSRLDADPCLQLLRELVILAPEEFDHHDPWFVTSVTI